MSEIELTVLCLAVPSSRFHCYCFNFTEDKNRTWIFNMMWAREMLCAKMVPPVMGKRFVSFRNIQFWTIHSLFSTSTSLWAQNFMIMISVAFGLSLSLSPCVSARSIFLCSTFSFNECSFSNATFNTSFRAIVLIHIFRWRWPLYCSVVTNSSITLMKRLSSISFWTCYWV